MHTYYACNGFCNEATAVDSRYGFNEVVLYNPAKTPASVKLRVYFSDRDPIYWERKILVKAETNELLVFPDMDPDIFRNCGHWGAQYESTHPLLINHICLDGIEHPQSTYKGGVQSVMGTPLSKEWYYADGVFLDWVRFHNGDYSKIPFPFHETEVYYFLNPNREPAQIQIELQYRNLDMQTVSLQVDPERLGSWSTLDQLPPCEPFGVKIVSDQPIATSYVRYVYGLQGLDEWGMHVHFALAGTPGPIV